jgi:dihydrofolate reductase
LASSTPNRNRSASTFRRTEALLLGRRTYEIFAGSWGVWDENAEGLQGELTRRYNRIPKYVASRTLTETRALPSGVLVNTYRPSDAG